MVSDTPPHFRAQVVSITVGFLLIGIGLALYIPLCLICFRFLCFTTHSHSKSRNRLLAFVSFSFVITLTNLLTGFVNDTNIFLCSLGSHTSVTVQQCNDPTTNDGVFRRHSIVTVCRVLMYILADGMLFYRAIVIWQRNWWILISIGVSWIGTEVFQIYSQVIAFDLTSHLLTIAGSYWASALWDVLTSSLIISRLLYYRGNARRAESNESAVPYTSLAAVFFEASLLFSSARMMYAGLVLTKKPFLFSYWSATLVDIAAAISPLFVILRLALNSFVDPFSPRKRRDGRSSPDVVLSTFHPASALRSILAGAGFSNDGSGFSGPAQSREFPLGTVLDVEGGEGLRREEKERYR